MRVRACACACVAAYLVNPCSFFRETTVASSPLISAPIITYYTQNLISTHTTTMYTAQHAYSKHNMYTQTHLILMLFGCVQLFQGVFYGQYHLRQLFLALLITYVGKLHQHSRTHAHTRRAHAHRQPHTSCCCNNS